MKKRLFSLLLLLTLLLGGCAETTVPEPPSPVSGQVLTVHFIDVGQADCALLECDGKAMLIDGGNREDGSLVVSYLEQQGISQLDTVICTHAHEDHVGGLPAVLAVYPTERVYSPTKSYSSNIYDDFLYYVNQQDLEIILPTPGEHFSLGSAEVRILGPVKSYAETNDTSIVLRVDYADTSFLFTGDIETTAETDMLDYWETQPELLQADVLKVGHHGSNTSTGYRFLHEVDPDYGIISCGQGNSYGHPHEEPLSRLNQAGVTLLRTDKLGHILATTDGSTITFTWSNQSAIPDNTEPGESVVFIGNKNSKKLHSQDCANLPAEKNRVSFDTYQQAIAAGYSPCGSCLG